MARGKGLGPVTVSIRIPTVPNEGISSVTGIMALKRSRALKKTTNFIEHSLGKFKNPHVHAFLYPNTT